MDTSCNWKIRVWKIISKQLVITGGGAQLDGISIQAKNKLNWQPEVDFKGLVKNMVQSDLELAEKESVLIERKLMQPTWEYPQTN